MIWATVHTGSRKNEREGAISHGAKAYDSTEYSLYALTATLDLIHIL